MLKNISRSFLLLIIFTIILGLIYPLTITGISRILFPEKSSGSLIYNDGRLIGSELIGQNFTGDKYFHPRPSAAGKGGYDPLKSGGSNLSPSNEEFITAVEERTEEFKKENGIEDNIKIPSDIVTASASGLDPDISVDSALLQAERISRARNIPVEKIEELVLDNVKNRELGFLGEPRVNVLKLNLLLDNL